MANRFQKAFTSVLLQQCTTFVISVHSIIFSDRLKFGLELFDSFWGDAKKNKNFISFSALSPSTKVPILDLFDQQQMYFHPLDATNKALLPLQDHKAHISLR